MRMRTVLLVWILVTLFASSAAAPADVSVALSDLMTKLQLQHAKLWFAGKLSNWHLADYEVQQIGANLEAARKLLADPSQADRVQERLRAVRKALQSKDVPAFMASYGALTNECNGCHRSSGYASIVMQIPLTLPVPNQLFVDQVSEGRALANASCGTCHLVADTVRDTPAFRPPPPGFPEIVSRPSFSADGLRQFLTSSHRRLGPDQAMPNPRLSESQIEAIVAYLETLRADQRH
ncbi:c-type cytochrome [Bradyrhizobium sp. WYCCWR 13022]|uniref:c-type cytochrome n=1 Tax=unclassified Bradyrhizobium TaxID=2631580 RepID=UPI00263B1982|nr:c-type cytochrome [Bradyrhizobium sp. WYCCWR 13022]MDN4982182.1 c-type cytochrome [Bradyrhizobium sp. WYCCWR 13022]